MLRKNSDPQIKRRFPSFTAGRCDSEEHETGSGEEYESEDTDEYDQEHQESNNNAQTALHALTHKLSVLQNELETIKSVKSREQSPRKIRSERNAMENAENISGLDNGGDLEFNMERIEKTLKAAEEVRTGEIYEMRLKSTCNRG